MANINKIKLPNNTTYDFLSKATVVSTDPGAGTNLSEGSVVAVILPTLTGISVTTPPTKTSYSVGETLDLTGMVVTATYDNSSTANVTSLCSFSPDDGDELSTEDTVITVSYEGFTATQSIEVVSIKIYGALWDGTSSPAWTRTDDAVGFVDPNPYYAGMSGTPSSPFDNIMPWSGMQIVEDTEAGTLVSIPKFYYNLTQTGSELKIQISDTQADGFVCSPAHMDRGDGNGERDVVYVGRYHCGSTAYKSVTGQTPKNSISRSTARTNIHNLGSHIWLIDFATRFTIWMLYLVEFADWNSQAKIGYGCGNGSNVQAMGYTDSMSYHTGTTQSSRTTYGLGTQYRNIEGLWDNVYDFTDGCYCNSNGLNIILNPANFSDSSGGVSVGIPVYAYPSAFAVKDVSGTYPVFISSQGGGSGSTYSCDFWSFNTSSPVLNMGGSYAQIQDNGLFGIGRANTTSASADRGCRLMELPNTSS